MKALAVWLTILLIGIVICVSFLSGSCNRVTLSIDNLHVANECGCPIAYCWTTSIPAKCSVLVCAYGMCQALQNETYDTVFLIMLPDTCDSIEIIAVSADNQTASVKIK